MISLQGRKINLGIIALLSYLFANSCLPIELNNWRQWLTHITGRDDSEKANFGCE